MAGFIVTEVCPSCRRPRSPLEMIQHFGFRQCMACDHRHAEALNCLATGTPPKECSECYTPWENLQARGEDRMICHMEAGRYRFMCTACDAIYTPKRRELYGPTEYGRKNGLI